MLAIGCLRGTISLLKLPAGTIKAKCRKVNLKVSNIKYYYSMAKCYYYSMPKYYYYSMPKSVKN